MWPCAAAGGLERQLKAAGVTGHLQVPPKGSGLLVYHGKSLGGRRAGLLLRHAAANIRLAKVANNLATEIDNKQRKAWTELAFLAFRFKSIQPQLHLSDLF